MSAITTIAELEAIYGQPAEPAILKERDHITPLYRKIIDAAPFVALATAGPEGLDCSPRGDKGAVVTCVDPKTLMLPDRRGNNRTDSLKNIVRNPHVALMFIVPGSLTILRVNGRAIVTADADICARFEVKGKRPRTVIAIDVEAVYFQCARAIMRADLWERASRFDPSSLPSVGAMLTEASNGQVGGEDYDKNWPEQAAKTLW